VKVASKEQKERFKLEQDHVQYFEDFEKVKQEKEYKQAFTVNIVGEIMKQQMRK
jgi:hypothetical protein